MRILPVIQNLVGRRCDGHFDPHLVGKRLRVGGGIVALHHGTDLLYRLLRRSSLPNQNTAAAISGVHGGTGDDQVPHARQSGKGLFPSAHGHAQPGDLGKSPGHKGGFCVVATTHAVAATGTERDHILQGGGQLHSHGVVGGIDAEPGAHEHILHQLGRPLIL